MPVAQWTCDAIIAPMSWGHLHHQIGRLALLWFVLALGVAAASPWIAPQSYQLVCAQGTVQLLVVGDDGPAELPQGHTLDCALCLLVGAPPADAPDTTPPTVRTQRGARWAQAEAPRVAGVRAPLPARGPPVQAV